MTNKEASEIIRINLEGLMASPTVTLDPKLIEAERAAIKALELTETHNIIEKGVLKQRGEGYVYYDINWLKKWWRHEMEILGINTWE